MLILYIFDWIEKNYVLITCTILIIVGLSYLPVLWRPKQVNQIGHNAGVWKRLCAAIVDDIILMIPIPMICVILIMLDITYSFLLMYLTKKVLSCCYCSYFESSRWQATPGKLLLSLHVTDYMGQQIQINRALLRFCAKILGYTSGCTGFIFSMFNNREQTLHDIVAETLVLDKQIEIGFCSKLLITALVLSYVVVGLFSLLLFMLALLDIASMFY
ncbi:MAG: RDD family protein [Acidobacteriota bacterium]